MDKGERAVGGWREVGELSSDDPARWTLGRDAWNFFSGPLKSLTLRLLQESSLFRWRFWTVPDQAKIVLSFEWAPFEPCLLREWPTSGQVAPTTPAFFFSFLFFLGKQIMNKPLIGCEPVTLEFMRWEARKLWEIFWNLEAKAGKVEEKRGFQRLAQPSTVRWL